MDIVIVQHQMFQLVAENIFLLQHCYVLIDNVMQIFLFSYKQQVPQRV